MEEPRGSGELLEKMSCMFPHIPKEIVQYCVNQNTKDEKNCIKVLHQIQNAFIPAFQPVSDEVTNSDNVISQLQNLNMNNGSFENCTDLRKSPKNTEVRSISDAGLPQVPVSGNLMGIQSQTAPTSSTNYQGFNYGFYVPYGGHSAHGANNNVMYQPVITRMDNGLLLPVAVDSYVRSHSPRLENSNVRRASASPTDNHNIAAVKSASSSRANSPIVPPRPLSSSYMFPPRVNSIPYHPGDLHILPNMHRTTSSPGVEYGGVEDPGRNRSPLPESAIDHNSQLRINIEPNDNLVHDWVPIQSLPTSLSYPQISPVPFQLMSSSQGQVSALPNYSLYQPELVLQDQGPSPPRWTQAPMMPPHDIQKYVALQRQGLDTLRSEMEKMKILHANLKKENLELKKNSCQPTKDDVAKLKEEIELLKIQCFSLCGEVDRYLKGEGRLGEINDDFYSCLNTGQQGPLLPPRPVRPKVVATKEPKPTCSHQHQYSSEEDEENKESNKWKCAKCTFANHPAISVCEMCIEPRIESVHKDCGDGAC